MVAIKLFMIGGIALASLTIRYDDTTHRKLKIIAAYQDISLNALMISLFDECVTKWESEHGPLGLPDEGPRK